MFNMTTLCWNDRCWSCPKLFECSINVKHVLHFYAPTCSLLRFYTQSCMTNSHLRCLGRSLTLLRVFLKFMI